MKQRFAVERRHPPDALMRFVNPVTRRLVRLPAAPEELAILHFTGLRSGRIYAVPVGYRTVDGLACVFTSSPWRLNLRGCDVIEVTQRGRRRPMRIRLVEDASTVAGILTGLIQQRGTTWAGRHLGIRINLTRTPTHEEVQSMVERSGLSVLWLEAL